MSFGNLYLISDLHLGDPRLDLFSRDLYFNSVDQLPRKQAPRFPVRSLMNIKLNSNI